ncbi:hypothetical protein BD408DRAFT_415964 [Parasitella parasitica]|nr:hypothetical protein BD408DRAFT_415964 [Parasitella parasitica]
MPPAWDKLPFEILTFIFEYIEPAAVHSRRYCRHYQLVCKGWSKAAQALLYKNISLQDAIWPADDYNSPDGTRIFGKFVDTVGAVAPHLGALVKKLTICSTFYQFDYPLTTLGIILNACPYIEELYCNGCSDDIVWPHLLTLQDSQLANIRSFYKDDATDTSKLYPFVALKLRKSLVNLHLNVRSATVAEQPPKQWRSRFLIQQLPQFICLKTLHFAVCEFHSYDILCQVIDKCSPTVTRLNFYRYLPGFDSSLDEETIKAMKPNYGVEEIYIAISILYSIKYFMLKFKNLEKFTAENLGTYECLRDGWFAELTELCTSLKVYSISFNLMREEFIKDSCVELTTKAAHGDKRLLIKYNAYETDAKNPCIELKKDCSCSRIEVYLPEDDDDFNYHTHWLEGYFPSVVEIENIENIGGNVVFKYSPTDGHVEIHNERLEQGSPGKKAWTILDKVISCSASTPNVNVSLSKMILIGSRQQTDVPSSSNIKQLTFKNSTFQSKLLPALSAQLPILETLMLDSCHVLMDEERHTLKIFLPTTRLQRLGLSVIPLSCIGHSTDGTEFGKDRWEAIPFAVAISPGRKYTLKIETEAKTYTIDREEGCNGALEYTRKQDIHRGTEGQFLVWIKCRELREISLLITSSQQQVEHRFEQLE